MSHYNKLSKTYDLLDLLYFSEKGRNPREVITEMIPNENINVLDLCCGTSSNTIPIAKLKPNIKVLGIDLSEQMIYEAKRKISQLGIKNIDLKCADATKTGLPDQSVDCVILGLVLHESSPSLISGILTEANRVLKDSGNLIVLEWEQQKKYPQIIKFAPLYLLERLNCKTFKTFYSADKAAFFKEYGFVVEQEEHCNYTVVLKLKASIFQANRV